MSVPSCELKKVSGIQLYTKASPAALRIQRLVAGSVVALPLLGTIYGLCQLCTFGVTHAAIWIFIVMYTLTMLGITVGFHRHFTHSSFKTSPILKWLLGILGSMAAQGPLIFWVASHRRHHRHSDQEGDPHSPQLASGKGFERILRGFWHGHIGWMFSDEITNWAAFAPDVMKDSTSFEIHRFYAGAVLLGLIVPTAAGFFWIGGWTGAGQGFLWGGLVRLCLVDHALWCVGSICHMYGHRPFQKMTQDCSSNNFLVSFFAFGEGMQNNHHAFPNAANHGFHWWEPDFSQWIIRLMAKLRLIWNVKFASAEAITKAKDTCTEIRRNIILTLMLGNLFKQFKAKPVQKAKPQSVEDIQNWIKSTLATYLKISESSIDIRQPFSSFGLDSLAAVRISGEIEEWLNLRLEPTLLWDFPNALDLADYLAKELRLPGGSEVNHSNLAAP